MTYPAWQEPADLIMWPCWLPLPEQETYQYEQIDPTKFLQMEIGSLRRRTFDFDALTISCSLILDECQAAFFETFENDLMKQGTLWFYMPLLLGGQILDYRVRFNSRPKVTGVKGFNTLFSFSIFVGRRRLQPVNADSGYLDPASNVLPVWPTWMPNLLQDGYSYELIDNVLVGAKDIPTRKRVDFLQIDEGVVSAKFIFNHQQLAFFEAFERDILRDGCRWFSLPLWVAGERKSYRVRFREKPKQSMLTGISCSVTVSLEFSQRELLDPDLATWLLYLSPENIEFVMTGLHSVVHEKMPGVTNVPTDIYQRRV